MDTRIWGPHAWEFLHTITFNYPQHPTAEDKQQVQSFFQHVGPILPCPTCRTHFQNLLQQHPIEPHLVSRDRLSRWLVDIHNQVNQRLHKPSLNYEFVKDKYDDMRSTCPAVSTNSASSSSALSDSKHAAKCPVWVWIVIGAVLLIAIFIAIVSYLKHKS
jgi:hypothetical protein